MNARRTGLIAILSGLLVWACAPAGSEDASQGESALGGSGTATGRFIDKKEAVPNEFIVVFAPTLAPIDVQARAKELAGKHQARVLHTYETVLSGFAARMSDEAARELANDPSIKYVERNGIKHISEVQDNATWGIDRVDQESLPLDHQYSYGLTGEGVNAVVIDTGVDARHPDFEGRVTTGFNALSTGAADDTTDGHGHGTHVSGTVAGKTWGLAKKATIVPVRVCSPAGQCTDADIIKAVEWVTANVAKPAVANMSLGGGVDDATIATEEAIKASVASGIVYVVAAGNDSVNACSFSPARIPEVITVGATSSNDARAYFSNYGTCLDVFAPGNSITSARRNSTSSTVMSGTSMASPHVAGAVARLLQAVPEATPAQIADLVHRNATPNKVTNPGNGSPNFLLHVGADPILSLDEPGDETPSKGE